MCVEEQETTDDRWPIWKPHYYIPTAKVFGDLFTSFEPCRGPERCRATKQLVHCSVSSCGEDPWIWSFDAAPTQAVLDVLGEMQTCVYDPFIYIDIIVRDDGSCLVTGKYNKVIGSRWLAEIDPASIPRGMEQTSWLPPTKSTKTAAVALPKPKAFTTDRKDRVAELLGMVEVRGNTAHFTGGQIDDWELYKDAMEKLGGAWVGGRTQGFRFGKRIDVAEVIATALATGRFSTEAKDADFVPTDRPLAEQLVEMACITHGARVLEPEAGQGGIADVIRETVPGVQLVLCEYLEENRDVLIDKGYGDVLIDERDFERATFTDRFDAIVMNPPFKREIEHVTKAHSLLRSDAGRLVSIMSEGITFRTDPKTEAFRKFVKGHGGTIERLPEKSFKHCGIYVNTVVVVIPAAKSAS